MYCYVIFGASNNWHTRNYLYNCEDTLVLGDIVIVPAKDTTKIALVKAVFDIFPENLNIDKTKIKSVISKYYETVGEVEVKSFLLALIDEYKDGTILKEELIAIMNRFVNFSKLSINSDKLKFIIYNQLPAMGVLYIDKPGAADQKELGFWKELKDIEYRLRYGFSFWEKDQHRVHPLNEDSIEYEDRYMINELELERLIRKEIGEGGYRGYCHLYWYTKQKILKDKFGIDWKSPVELNPAIIFD